MPDAPRIAYLFSRYPVVSQTFCDTEIMALERQGLEIEIGSINPPLTSFRHGHLDELKAPVHYAPHPDVRKVLESRCREAGEWPEALVADHEKRFGPEAKSGLRARNAVFFAQAFRERGVGHVHVHFANRATHAAVFLKAISGIPFSFTAHAQDFMVDMDRALLGEICRHAEFVVCVSDFSRGLLANMFPSEAAKFHRVYNGICLDRFPVGRPGGSEDVRIVSIGRLIPFKGFHHLIAACGILHGRGVRFHCEIIGDGPLRESLLAQIGEAGLSRHISLAGILPQEEVARRLGAANIFALACDIDGNGACDILPTVILEAMATGKPVVSTRIAGVPELVGDGVTGLLVERGNPAELARALFTLVADHELRQEFGLAGRRRVESTFRVETTSGELGDLFVRHAKVGGTAFVPPRRLPALVLLDQWEEPSLAGVEGDLLAALDAGVAVWACRPALPFRPSAPAPASRMHFLPDAMVIEAEWRANADPASRIERLRDELGTSLATETFLLHARHALFLVRSGAVRAGDHVHALGSPALLVAWILSRIAGVVVSATIEASSILPLKVVGSLAGVCAYGRVPSEALKDSLGKGFVVDDAFSIPAAGRERAGILGLFRRSSPPAKNTKSASPVWHEWLARWKGNT